jgi:GPH family glycoside/pentoside/hexuronide:cation symporter
VPQSEEALGGIRLLLSIIPGVLAPVNGVILFGYRLTDEELEVVGRELTERRKLDADPVSP